MASDTAPAAVPGPADPPPSTAPTTPANSGTGQQPSGMAGLLAPLEATRTAFTLDPTAGATAAEGEQTVTGASSAGFTTDDTANESPEKNTKTTSAKQQQSVIRAWMLAGAERWKKGGEARNKRLDVQKERAKARQVKENVTVNRSEKTVNGPGNSGTGSSKNSAGKSLSGKVNGGGKGTGTGSKNSSGPAGGGKPGGGKPGGGRGNAGSPTAGTSRSNGGSTGGGAGGSKNAGSSSSGRGSGTGAKHDKANGSRTGGKDHPGTGKRTAGASGADSGTSPKTSTHKQISGTTCGDTGAAKKPGPAGSSGKPGKDSGSTKSPSPTPGKGTAPHDKAPAAGTDKDTKPSTGKAQDKPETKTDPAKPSGTPQRSDSKTTDSSKNTDPANPSTAKDTTTKPDPAKTDATSKNTTPRPNGTPTPRINLQTSREAGYRDGTRAAKAVAHAAAWRDGARDGYRDTTEAADREKTRLDQAHAARKNTRTEAPPVTQPATQTIPPKPDHAPGPQPVPVASVDSTHIHLGEGSARPHISRGEVRTLRNFQQRLQHKTDRMTVVADATRTLEQHARQQAKQITDLLEQARAVKGGEKLAAALTKLADAAEVQATKAAEIHERAVRSSDACQALHTNSETRYGGIYKAVLDSPETAPAEMNYYREMGHAHA